MLPNNWLCRCVYIPLKQFTKAKHLCCRPNDRYSVIKIMFCQHVSMSGWPSGLRRQTQVLKLAAISSTRFLVFDRRRGFKSHFGHNNISIYFFKFWINKPCLFLTRRISFILIAITYLNFYDHGFILIIDKQFMVVSLFMISWNIYEIRHTINN